MYRLYVVSPLGALTRGMVAGAIGSAAMTQFFKYTFKFAPPAPQGAFEPPEERQKDEMVVETMARRVAEGLMKRGPLDAERKRQIGKAVHVATGSLWGGLYGLARESAPELGGAGGAAAFSTLAWAVDDNAILPAFRLSAWPQVYPARWHAYALLAHLVYGAVVAGSYGAMRRQFWDVLGAGIWAFGARRRLRKYLPKQARPAARAVVHNLAAAYARRPIERARAVVGA